ncbi:hypothetical protein DFJ73DRAFT_827762 [Zopfochytrium polystomum]|nr:hypothetical protein DFJ73DRAFT_827762 [Zopfochytrium polystomum]
MYTFSISQKLKLRLLRIVPTWIQMGALDIAFLSLLAGIWTVITTFVISKKPSAIAQIQGAWALISIILSAVGLYGIAKMDRAIIQLWVAWYVIASLISVVGDVGAVSYVFVHLDSKHCLREVGAEARAIQESDRDECKDLTFIRLSAVCIATVHTILSAYFFICVACFWREMEVSLQRYSPAPTASPSLPGGGTVLGTTMSKGQAASSHFDLSECQTSAV